MHVMIVGCNGALGGQCARRFEALGELVTGVDLPELDITDEDAVRARVEGVGPELIVNCAAFTDVDGCEQEREAARRVNADGPRFLARAARAAGARFIHVSTDYVFDGERAPPRAYAEDDCPSPQSWYGKTKLAGERAVMEEMPAAAVARTAWLYDARGSNFIKAILKQILGRKASTLRVVNDQHGSPTWARRLAEQMAVMAGAETHGIYHATAQGCCTWYELAQRVVAWSGADCTVEPCDSSAYPRPATRPGNSILDNARLRQAGLEVMVDWREDLDDFLATCGGALRAEAMQT